MAEPTTSDKILLALVAGADPARAAAHFGVPATEVADAVAQARRRLTIAADYNRDEQLGLAVSRLNELYAKLREAREYKLCLPVQKELNRLMDLYRPAAARRAEGAGRAEAEVLAVRGHLAPLRLAPPETGVDELARLAVAEIVQLRNAR